MPIYFLGAARERVTIGLPDAPLQSIAIEETATHMKSLADIDAHAIGVAREKHHRYLLHDPATKGIMFCAGSERVGYAYIGSDGHIGPLAVKRAEILDDALASALKIAADGGSKQISAFLPGTCHGALSLAVKQGMRITFPMLLMASPGFGDWTQYLPRNPGFM
jgi:hypothetical protein